LKLITHSLATITDGSEKIEQALGEAANEIASQVGALPSKVSNLLVEMAKDFQAIAIKLGELPGLLDPQPMSKSKTFAPMQRKFLVIWLRRWQTCNQFQMPCQRPSKRWWHCQTIC
jgi:predicted  nucleic acid-binding Zn ribbon protein